MVINYLNIIKRDCLLQKLITFLFLKSVVMFFSAKYFLIENLNLLFNKKIGMLNK